jgi:hypothetical protein
MAEPTHKMQSHSSSSSLVRIREERRAPSQDIIDQERLNSLLKSDKDFRARNYLGQPASSRRLVDIIDELEG